MKLTPVLAGYFKLDGGPMFGVVPRSLWAKLNPPDENNMCTWAMRSLLIESGEKKIIVDTGIGNKQGEKFRSHFEPHGPELNASLLELSLHPEEITDVFISHFHFDHVGGALAYDEEKNIQATFPNATYWSNEVHYRWAVDPNPREKASFLKENFVPLREMGILQFIDYNSKGDDVMWMEGLRVRFIDGHTRAQMILFIDQQQQTTVFCADLIPSRWHIRLPYVMAYDVEPLKSIEEKERLLVEAVEEDFLLHFEHDPQMASSRVMKDERGRYILATNS